MSAATSVINIEELLNSIKPHRYLATWREGGRVKHAAVEPNEVLATLPGMTMKVADVKARALDVQPPRDVLEHPRVKWLSGLVGKPPALRLFQYTFTPLKTRLIQRLDTGVELYEAVPEPDGSAVIVHVVHAFYVAYISNSGRIYGETPGGARAYVMAERGQLKTPQIYIHRIDKHKYEIGVRIPIDGEQVRQLISLLGL
jgi:hypothetical protein